MRRLAGARSRRPAGAWGGGGRRRPVLPGQVADARARPPGRRRAPRSLGSRRRRRRRSHAGEARRRRSPARPRRRAGRARRAIDAALTARADAARRDDQIGLTVAHAAAWTALSATGHRRAIAAAPPATRRTAALAAGPRVSALRRASPAPPRTPQRARRPGGRELAPAEARGRNAPTSWTRTRGSSATGSTTSRRPANAGLATLGRAPGGGARPRGTSRCSEPSFREQRGAPAAEPAAGRPPSTNSSTSCCEARR